LNTTKGVQEVAESLGWQVVVNEEVPYETTQWSGILSKLREADPSLIYLELLDPAAVNTFASQFTQNPAKNALLYLGYTLSVPAFGEVIKLGSAEGMLGMTLSAQRPDDTGRAFVEAWRAKYNEDPPFSIAAQIYDELKMWAHAVEQAGSVEDHKAIREAILGTPYEGLTGRFEFNDEQYVPSTDDTVPTHLLQVQGGQPVQVRIGTKKIADFVAPPWLQ
jgi:branched-chain amino acid transport system substrate-binding protein